MRSIVKGMLAVAAGMVFTGPAHAAGSTVLPEPGTLTLLSMGLAGVIIGRRFARKPPER